MWTEKQIGDSISASGLSRYSGDLPIFKIP